MEKTQPKLILQRPRCPYCKDEVAAQQEKLACDGCMAWHHAECWSAHGVCSACGHAEVTGATKASAARSRVLRPCRRHGCPSPAVASVAHHEWCREHGEELLKRLAQSPATLVAVGLSLLCAVAALVAAVVVEHPNFLTLAIIFAVAALGFFLDGSKRRRNYEEQLRKLERLEQQDPKPPGRE